MELLESGFVLKKAKERFYEEITKKYDITSVELSILLFLNNSKYDTATDIVSELYIAKSHISVSVASLVKKGYIEKEIDKDDNKILHLKLKSKANEILMATKDKLIEYEKNVFKGLSDENKNHLERIYKIVDKNIKNILERR